MFTVTWSAPAGHVTSWRSVSAATMIPCSHAASSRPACWLFGGGLTVWNTGSVTGEAVRWEHVKTVRCWSKLVVVLRFYSSREELSRAASSLSAKVNNSTSGNRYKKTFTLFFKAIFNVEAFFSFFILLAVFDTLLSKLWIWFMLSEVGSQTES